MGVTLGAMTRVFSKCSLEEALERIARVGFSHVALTGQNQGKRAVRTDMTDAEVDHIRRVMERTGLQGAMTFTIDATIDLEDMRTKIRRTAELGFPTMVFVGPRGTGAGNAADREYLPGEREQFAATLADLVGIGNEYGVSLSLKPHGGPTGWGQGLKELLKTPGAEGVGVYYDPGNIRFYQGLKPEEDLKIIAAQTRGLCVKDHCGAAGNLEFPTPGDGEVEWERIFATLAEAEFTGPALIELVSGETPDEVEKELGRAKTFLEALL